MTKLRIRLGAATPQCVMGDVEGVELIDGRVRGHQGGQLVKVRKLPIRGDFVRLTSNERHRLAVRLIDADEVVVDVASVILGASLLMVGLIALLGMSSSAERVVR